MSPRSLRTRLILGAFLWTIAGVGGGWFIITSLIREFVVAQLDHELIDHVEELASLADAEQKQLPTLSRNLSDARFIQQHSGLYWQIRFSNGLTTSSPSLDKKALPFDLKSKSWNEPSTATGPTGSIRFLQREVQLAALGDSVQIGVGADERLIDEAAAKFNVALAWMLAIIAIGLIGAASVQIAYGLQPLSRIRHAIHAVRAGDADRLPDDLPTEVLPLVTEINDLIAANLEMLNRARTQSGTLAHALKTPLIVLMEESSRIAAAGHHEMAQALTLQCSRMSLEIDFQTARARTSTKSNIGSHTDILPILSDLISAFMKLNRSRDIHFELECSSDLFVNCDARDLGEMIGNIVDNATKWARSRVTITVKSVIQVAIIRVSDDGRGIAEDFRETVFGIGTRLEESIPGSGLGLAITRDLVGLYGGRIWIEQSDLGGAAVLIELPLSAL